MNTVLCVWEPGIVLYLFYQSFQAIKKQYMWVHFIQRQSCSNQQCVWVSHQKSKWMKPGSKSMWGCGIVYFWLCVSSEWILYWTQWSWESHRATDLKLTLHTCVKEQRNRKQTHLLNENERKDYTSRSERCTRLKAMQSTSAQTVVVKYF